LTPLERALRDSLSPPKCRDVVLYAFSRRTVYADGTIKVDHPLPIAAIGSVLKETEHFSKLLTSGFTETNTDSPTTAIRQFAFDSEYDYETDSDLDEFDVPGFPPESEASSSLKGKGKASDDGRVSADLSSNRHQILIPNIAHRTLKACIFYLYTGKIKFLPLISEGGGERAFAMMTSLDGPPACSPKSMYRLADTFGINDLRDSAYREIISRLNIENIVTEAFSSFFARYDRLREHAVSYLSRHYSKPSVQGALPAVIEKTVLGELPHASGVLLSLLGLR
ncbi:uncharacterized protein BXZ73DRAFT_22478, partial [Epithele typhae]|uniref:uncharacterized protein n=1 Tax=Epithele typhae TaxID=378194 RepID=UPI002007C72F